ncbi:MAG: transporter [Desulfuromonadaceae bacterium]|nr:transporter [Desulfuromonadaceae bacterium]
MQEIRKIGIRAVLVAGIALCSAGAAFAGHPLITDDAGVVEVKHVEVELNGAYNRDRDRSAGISRRTESSEGEVRVTTGVFKDVHVALSVPYTFNLWGSEDNLITEKSRGFGDMTAEVKYKFLEYGGFDFTVKPYAIIPTGKYSAGLSDGRWGFGGALISTKEFADGKYAIHANVVYEHHDYKDTNVRNENRSNLWNGSIAGEAEVLHGFKALLNFGVGSATDKAINDVAGFALVGASYEIIKNLEVNAGVKFGLTRAEDDLSALWGATIKF